MTTVLLFLLLLIGPSINPIRQGIQCSLVFWIPSSRYSVLDSRSLSVELGFRISIFRGILDSKSQDSGIPTPPPHPTKQFRGFPNMGRFDVLGSFQMFACGQNKTRYRSGAYSSRRVGLLLLDRC